ncbi:MULTISPECIES: putative phage tail protein [unclassified Variovorax]|uniref:YmfQ family protein n=1 Tax=unclassified Variovorax TaxID=663243 RepID=UPI00076D2F6B|nr:MULTISPECIES: putative phage tail protein [unclassified Variovorax]KWT89364.1 hypothetical protein APY03_3443 [Variovorax sp. WDL1]PNG56540.1 hypothetical protein CHC07_02959 [Variovorax sp. B4]PNG57964.1 hypothetical protein CHC06_02962 [Variovorax sp. B2]VTV09566.1 hypothetical protein WDL1CHR_00664 [Variovorax sp. WDL1]
MGAPFFSAADYLAALQALLPRGRVWPRDADAVQTKALIGLAPTYERQNARSNQLLIDAFPASTIELLPEWEETLGLPDPCAGPSPTIAARRAQVVARITSLGGQSVPYFIAYALALGYVITITEFIPARVGIARAGDPLRGVDWAHAWQVNASLHTVVRARVGISQAGEPLAYWNNTVLECELREVMPAHTVLIFSYT